MLYVARQSYSMREELFRWSWNEAQITIMWDTASAVSAQLYPPKNAYRGPPNGDL